MMRFESRKNRCRLLWLLWICLWPVEAPGSLPPGVGQFDFGDPEAGREIQCWYVRAESHQRGDPPVIVFHGMNRNPADYRDAWIDDARRFGLFVIVPYFSEEDFPGTVGYNLGNLFPSESDLTRNPPVVSGFRVPKLVFEHLVAADEASSDSGYMVFGHSAGAQFVHRMTALFPDPNLRLAIAANAGWYTFPDLSQDWPYGFKGTGLTEAELPVFLGTNLVILLGDRDVDENHPSLRRTPEAMLQGSNRFERGHRFFEAGKARATRLEVLFGWRLEVVPGVAHSQSGMAPAAAALMADAIRRNRPGSTLPPGN